jgi:uncharacterized membrane protein YfcA
VDASLLLGVAAIGAVIGFLGGLFGKGGSAIATPLLHAIGIPAFVAVASPLPATIPSTMTASAAYWKERLVDWSAVRWSIGVGVPATILGAYASRWIGGDGLIVITELLVAALGVRFLLGKSKPEAIVPEHHERKRMVLVASAVGLVSGLLANGGGFLLAPLFVIVLGLPIKRAFASSLMVAAALAVPGSAVHALLGHIDWTVVLVFGAASVPLSFVGARVALRTHAPALERLFGAMLLTVGLGLLVFE